MKTQNTRQEILAQRSQYLKNIATTTTEEKQNHLRSRGHVLYSDAKAQGFVKVGWDVYQRPADADAGQIWSLEDIDGDKWLVCYTDANDHILRNIAKESFKLQMKKTAGNITEPIIGYGLKPGDLVTITPRHEQSVHAKYAGLKGVVSAAMPDRAQLTFGDGSSMWFENTDLTPIVDAKEMEIGDDVRMFARNVSGKLTKISNDGKYVTFENDIGQEFHARKNEVVKQAILFIHTDPFSDSETKAFEKVMKNVYNPTVPAATPPGAGGEGMPQAQPPAGGGGTPQPSGNDIPPSIKQMPTSREMEMGTAMPAGDIGMGADMGMGMPMANAEKTVKTGRRMNVGDTVQKKSTGEKGTIVDIQFDRKLGKFYLIDFGSYEPETIYDTDLMKLKDFEHDAGVMPMPTEVTPGPTRFIGAKRAVLDPKFEHIKDAALDFVSGMVSQALKNHEVASPGAVPPPQLEEALAKQAITTYISKYLPAEYRQIMADEEKNSLSEWLLFELGDTTEDAPTAQEFTPGENTAVPAQRTPQEMASELVKAHIDSHTKVAKYTPARFVSPLERNRFIREAVTQLRTTGIEDKTAQFLIYSIMTGDISDPFVAHSLRKQFAYEPERIEQLLDVASTKLATSLFTTTHGEKYALDLPGMETLRGGGGGYPGGMDVDPMGWEVKDPAGAGAGDPAQIEQALMEQLGDQSKPFDEAAPTLNIELDTKNKQIIIDYNQEEEPVMPIEGAPEGGSPPLENPSMPSPAGPGGPKPGDVKGPGGNEAANFNNMDIPVNF